MRIAVLLPCYNEEAAIADVVAGFQASLPGAAIYVYDNNSTDNTSGVAAQAGAIVRREPLKGKGNVVRRMFADIDADLYIMADGDGTYDAKAAPTLINKLLNENLDMLVGARTKDAGDKLYRPGHRFGNRMLNWVVRMLFGQGPTDMLSGYRVFSRRFVKSFPGMARGFEIETELTIHALKLRLPMDEHPTQYFDRAEGTESKLSTYKDGVRILSFILFFFKEIRPFWFFGLVALGLATLSLIAGVPVILEYFETGLVPRLPTAILSTGLMLSGVLSFICGVVLDTVARGRVEVTRLCYLGYEAPANDKDAP